MCQFEQPTKIDAFAKLTGSLLLIQELITPAFIGLEANSMPENELKQLKKTVKP